MQDHSQAISQAIDRFEAGAAVPRRAVEGLTIDQLCADPRSYGAAGWSIQQIVVHLWESDLAASHRMRRILAENVPLLIAYDETLAAERLSYNEEDLARVCRLFDDNRKMTAALLRRQPAEAFARVGIHNQRGKVTLLEFVTVYADHIADHMKHLVSKRALLKSPIQLHVP
jgi:hypothetical protein